MDRSRQRSSKTTAKKLEIIGGVKNRLHNILFISILLIFTMTFFGSLAASESISFPTLNSPNNAIKLIIKTYVQELLDDAKLDATQLKRKLSSMNDHIATHPALHQRYLWVGAMPPVDYNPDLHKISYERAANNRTQSVLLLRKRKSTVSNDGASDGTVTNEVKEQLPSEEICETKQKWEQINETHDLYDNKVKVIQQEDMKQFVFSYRCAKNKGKCLGISPLYESECTERFGWMYMYYKPENKPAQWGFVNAPHHCACRLKPKFYQPTISSAADEPMK